MSPRAVPRAGRKAPLFLSPPLLAASDSDPRRSNRQGDVSRVPARPGTQECACLATAPAECVLVPQGRELRDSSACPPLSLRSSRLLKTRNPRLRPLSHLHRCNDRRLKDPTRKAPTVDIGSMQVTTKKPVLAERVLGAVQRFNVKDGYGFINRNDTREDIFVHQTAITRRNPQKFMRSLYEGETIEFDVVVGEKGREAANVTGPDGEPVPGTPYAADSGRFRGRWLPRRIQRQPMATRAAVCRTRTTFMMLCSCRTRRSRNRHRRDGCSLGDPFYAATTDVPGV
ncbi:hypothetical protein HPB47_018965 [Ixodes persulcatus]|uniref:Uncharacterized protein n=1 Tax=Ixodes persulcatus TaxID=34615 RepID=A0AC60QLB6_IXOPE|nr:hypothetical protein HPB47_018965 [Ixodes persulcatus]